ncbi:MAG: substrate-binding domain-containing protein [Chitinophagaceae bacterium]
MRKKISLKDIAKKVGVSTALVSYVLNNQKEGRISKIVAQKIRDTAKELNYSTNQIAKSLKTNKTYTIGLIVSDISNPFSSSLARIIEDEAAKSDYTVIFGSSDENAERSFKLINVLLDRQVDGFIIAFAADSEQQINYLQGMEIPFVLIDRYFPGMNVSHVAINNYRAAYMAVKHLIDNGNKRIGMVTYKSTLVNLLDRKKGYIGALSDHNLLIEEDWIKEVGIGNNQEEIETAFDQLLSSPGKVEAVLFGSNILSTHGLKYINKHHIKVPDDLAIVSFDQSDASSLFYAPLTHIKQPLEEMGQLVTNILLQVFDKNREITQVNMDTDLIIGQSSLRTPL